MKKKITATLLSICLVGSPYTNVLCLDSTAPQSSNRHLCDSVVVLKGTGEGIAVGADVTLTVIDADETRSGLQQNNNSAAIVYYDEFTATEGNTYELPFAIANSGEYRAYIGIAARSEPLEVEFEYINAVQNASEIAAVMLKTNTAEILGNDIKRKDLGLFTKAYDIANISNAAEILDASLPVSAPTCDEMIVLGEKALLASALNSNNVIDINTYSDVFAADGTKKYIGQDNSVAVTALMSEKAINNVTDFDNLLKESVIVSLANQPGSAGNLKTALTEFASNFGIPAEKITANLCSAITNRGGFADMPSVVSFITSYVEPPATNSTTQNSGNFGGGGRGNAFVDSQVVTSHENDTISRDNYSVFTDLGSAEWAKEAITKLYNKGIVSGKSDTEYAPMDAVKREEFATIITSAFNINLVNEELSFTDISSEHWSYPYVRSAYLAGITSGITDTLFGLGMDIKRQDLCVMVYNALETTDTTLPNKRDDVVFSDEENISEYAREAVQALGRMGIVSGDDKGYFNPHASATRAEAAVVIYSLIK